MKSIIALMALFSLAIPVWAMSDAEKDAIRNGAVGKYIYRVVDDEGMPVSNAVAHVWFRSYGRPQDKADWVVLTDTNGMFTAEHRFNEKFSVGIDKEKYYHTHDEINYLAMAERPVKDGKWQPYGEIRTVMLKKITNPRVLIFCEGEYHEIPVFDTWVGYDLEKGDWVTPYGGGSSRDMQLRFMTLCDEGNDFRRTMEVSFTNHPYSGAYLMKRDTYSEFDTVYHADTNANFQSYFKYEFNHTGRKVFRDELNQDQYLVFRIRAEVDEKGRLKKAHYGKMLGNWKFFERNNMRIGRVFFNPTPNDTNLEDAETARLSHLGYKQRHEFERQRKAKEK